MAAKLLRFCVVAGVLPAAVGCYTYMPLDTSAGVPPGEHISVEVTDRGRAELSDRIGSGVLRIEGTLTRVDSQDMTMNVWRVAQIGGETARWSGESIKFRRDFVATVQTRSLNRPRTYVAAGVAVVGLFMLVKSTDLFGSFIGGLDPDPGLPPQSSRGWWP